MNSTGFIQAQPTFANPPLHTHHEVETIEKRDCSTVNDDPSLESKNVYQNPVASEQHPKVRQAKMLANAVTILFICSLSIYCISLFQVMAIPTFTLLGLLCIVALYADLLDIYYALKA